jgi:hypothetical protein
VIAIRFARAYLKAGISAEARVEENSQSTNTRVRESTVREFELDSGVIPTVESEINRVEIEWLSL